MRENLKKNVKLSIKITKSVLHQLIRIKRLKSNHKLDKLLENYINFIKFAQK